jgi:monoamine oxidase
MLKSIKFKTLTIVTCLCMNLANAKQNIYDVFIVGAGVSGVYSGYRLKQDNPKLNVVIAEMSNRIGGRLYSFKFPQTNANAEFGGMRFIPKVQPLVTDLIENKLKLAVSDTKFKFQGININDKTCYSNDNTFICQKYDNYLIYSASKQFGCSDSSITTSNLKIENCLKNKQFKGKKLSDYSSYELFSQLLSPSDFALLKQQSGYNEVDPQLSAVDIIADSIYFFSHKASYYTVNNGMQAIPLQLAQKFKQDNGEIYLNTKVVSIIWDKNTNYFNIKTINVVTNDESQFLAKKLIFAAGQYALQHIQTNFLNDNYSQSLINSVTPIKVDKVWMTFNDFWWHKLNINRGLTVTDKPIRMILYFDPLESSPFVKKQQALLDAAYTVGSSSSFFDNYTDEYAVIYYNNLTHQGYVSNNYNQIEPTKEAYSIAYTMINPLSKEVVKQLSSIHNMQVEQPTATLLWSWSQPPFGGAYHIWKPKVDNELVTKQISQIHSNIPFYVVGEAYSITQSWVEGALETSEYVLQKDFKLKKPF